tara:strand:+ start:590 stop:4633 length:4044 start_codon:yes stop_codon:yes gene_type:complete
MVELSANTKYSVLTSFRNRFSLIVAINTGIKGGDSVIDIFDSTGDKVRPGEFRQVDNLITLTYTGEDILSIPFAHYRFFTIQWKSGIIKRIRLLVQGEENSLDNHIPISIPLSDLNINTEGFDFSGGVSYKWKSTYNSQGINSILSGQNFTYSRINSILDPYDVFYNGESIIPTGSIIDLDNGGGSKSLADSSVYSDERKTFNAIPAEDSRDFQIFETIQINLNEDRDLERIDNAFQTLDTKPKESFASFVSNLTKGNLPYAFSSSVVIAQNIPSAAMMFPTYSVCLDVNSSSYYGTTGIDCYGTSIPSANLPGGSQSGSNFVQILDGNCCTGCSLDVTVTATDTTASGVNNGTVTINMENPPGTLSGSPWTAVDKSNYTITIVDSTGATITQQNPPAGNTSTPITCVTNITGGTEHEITVSSANNVIAKGMKVVGSNIPSNAFVGGIIGGSAGAVTKFRLVDNVGTYLPAVSAGTLNLYFSAGSIHVFGGLAANLGTATYDIVVTDSDGCIESRSVKVRELIIPILGCMTSSSLNYNASATTDDNSCLSCNSNGELEEASGAISSLLALTSALAIPTTGAAATDGSVYMSFIFNTSVIPYLDLDGTQSYTMKLYELTVPGDFTTAGSVLQTAAGLDVDGINPTNTFTGLSYGYYAVTVQLVDSTGGTQNIEECLTTAYISVQTPVCTNTLATNYNTSLPQALIISDSTLCTFPVVPDCCTLSNITVVGENTCSPSLEASIICSTTPTTLSGIWQLDGVDITGSYFNAGPVNQLTIYFPSFLVIVSGTYTLNIVSSYTSAPDCPLTTSTFVNASVCGCTDATALNYDPLAVLDNNTCTYPTYVCNPNQYGSGGGGCIQMQNGSGWPTLAQCNTNCTPPIISGCTDPDATNYNPAATLDDGSCTYEACLDSAASNYQHDCLGVSRPNATINNPGCCNYPCSVPPALRSAETYSATGGCTTPNSDGKFASSLMLNNGAPTFTVQYTHASSGNTLYIDPVTYSLLPTQVGNSAYTETTNFWEGITPGSYYAIYTDSFGCTAQHAFTIGSQATDLGCTDPGADNYDPIATCDDGSCFYCGCMDGSAWNYNPNASCDDGSCAYTVLDSPCIPKDIYKRISEAENCLSVKGTRYLSKLKTGLSDDCSIMNNWKLILVTYLLKKTELTCLYNCSDGSTPALNSTQAGTSCHALWAAGGPMTGANYAGQAFTSQIGSEGTTITNPASFFSGNSQSPQLCFGDVIKMPSGLIWMFTGPAKQGGRQCGPMDPSMNPETSGGGPLGSFWRLCEDSTSTITITDSTNYLDNFINFVNNFCKDCKIANTTSSTQLKTDRTYTSTNTLDVTQGGISFNINK